MELTLIANIAIWLVGVKIVTLSAIRLEQRIVGMAMPSIVANLVSIVPISPAASDAMSHSGLEILIKHIFLRGGSKMLQVGSCLDARG